MRFPDLLSCTGNLVGNKKPGQWNRKCVVALGSSFLCGAFVPAQFLPDSVLTVAHVLPSYWYIQTNEFLETLETVDCVSIRPALVNMGVLLGFALVFILVADVVSRRKRRNFEN